MPPGAGNHRVDGRRPALLLRRLNYDQHAGEFLDYDIEGTGVTTACASKSIPIDFMSPVRAFSRVCGWRFTRATWFTAVCRTGSRDRRVKALRLRERYISSV